MTNRKHKHGDKQLRKWWAAFVACGYNQCEMARKTGVPVPTWQSRIRAAKTRLGLKEPRETAMAAQRLLPVTAVPLALLRETWRAYGEHEYNQSQTALALGVSRQTLQARLDTARRELKVQEPPLDQREKLRHELRNATLTAELKQVRQELNDTEDFRKAVFGLVQQPVEPPAWTIKPQRAKGGPGTPILFTSDFQWGEVIRGAEMAGVNAFNKDVASYRYRLLIDKTIELAFEHMVRPHYDGLVYLRGGDMISGEIHDDLTQTNDLQSIPAVKDLVEHECAGIEALLSKFGRIHLIGVPGNHGRTTRKPQSKGYVERNFDTLTSWWLEMIWKKEKRLTFQTPASGDALFPIYGWNCVLTHGDRIGSRGGEGFIGAVATITRGMKKVADYYAALGHPVDLQFIGHFHTALELEYGFANGSLPGYSQYARDLRMRPQPPKQWLLFAHPRHGLTARWPVLLEGKPELPAGAKQEHVFAKAA